jgi:hypothetical protein
MHTGGWNRTGPVNKTHNQGKVFSERLGIFFRAERGRDLQVFSFRQDGKPEHGAGLGTFPSVWCVLLESFSFQASMRRLHHTTASRFLLLTLGFRWVENNPRSGLGGKEIST